MKETIRIFARLRPCKKPASYQVSSDDDGQTLSFSCPRDPIDGYVNNQRETFNFRFQRVFDTTTRQEEVFDYVAKPVIDRVLQGYNGTIFAYGQTGSGKTFSITGGAEDFNDRGIIPRTLYYIYGHFGAQTNLEFSVQISYLEIYNRDGFDLLDPKKDVVKMEDLPRVTVMDDGSNNFHLKNLSLNTANSLEEAVGLLFEGDTNRMIAETPMNQASTRSHCIFTVHLSFREVGSSSVKRCKLHLVDLAGSERVSNSGVSGQILREAQYINVSLHHLERVIIELANSKEGSHVPFRSSMMTMVLRDSLGGNCMTSMIATCSVDRRNIAESISTCRFAQRVATIKNEAVVNEELDPQLVIVRLRREVQQLREQIALTKGGLCRLNEALPPYDEEKCARAVEIFLSDPSESIRLDFVSVGLDATDLRIIDYAMLLLKRRVLQGGSAALSAKTAAQPMAIATTDSSACCDHEMIIQQKDAEINILVKMLDKEKRRSKGMETPSSSQPMVSNEAFGTSLATSEPPSSRPPPSGQPVGKRPTSNEHQSLVHDIPPSLPRPIPLNALSRSSGSSGRRHGEHHSTSSSPRPSAAEIVSWGRQQAFEHFTIKDSGGVRLQKAVIEQTHALNAKKVAAKSLGEQVLQMKETVAKLRNDLKEHRLRKGYQEVARGAEASVPSDELETELRERLQMSMASYKEGIEQLRPCKPEVEHMELFLKSTKERLLRRFEDWWSELRAQARQSSDGETRSKADRGFSGRSAASGYETESPTIEMISPAHQSTSAEVNLNSSIMPRAPATSKPTRQQSQSRPVLLKTGNPEVDAHIEAFQRNRRTILNTVASDYSVN